MCVILSHAKLALTWILVRFTTIHNLVHSSSTVTYMAQTTEHLGSQQAWFLVHQAGLFCRAVYWFPGSFPKMVSYDTVNADLEAAVRGGLNHTTQQDNTSQLLHKNHNAMNMPHIP